MAIADIRVLGAGIFGLSIAFACVKRGVPVQVVDPAGPGGGASGGLVGALAPHTPDPWNAKKQLQFDSLLLAERWWAEIAEQSGMDPGYARSGRVQAITDAHQLELARSRADAADQNWQGSATWTVRSADEFAGWVPETPTGYIVFDTLTARLHPRMACAAMAEALRQRGVSFLSSPEGSVAATVEATGVAGLEELSQATGRIVGNGVKGQAALLKFDAADQPQLFLDGIHIVPHGDGTVAIGSTSERDYGSADSVDGLLDALVERARVLCPALVDAPVVARWSGVRPRARSRAPMIGSHPLRPENVIANGGFKIGFGIAPAIAEMVADLVLEGVNHIPPECHPDASMT